MNAPIVGWVLQDYKSPKRSGACQRKFVLLLIAQSCNSQGWAVQETIRAIARAADLSERMAQRYMRELEAEGVLQVHKQANGAAANLYRVIAPGVDVRAKQPPELPIVRRRVALDRLSCDHSSPICNECLQRRLAA